MTKYVIAILVLASAVFALNYVNDLVVQYNHMSWPSQVATTIHCNTPGAKTIGDNINCAVINHL